MSEKYPNALYALFLAVIFAICLVPSVGTLFRPTTVSSENRAMAPAPQLLTEEGGVNTEVFAEFDDWFTDHVALRNQMVYADTMIQTTLFSTSPVSGVVYGTDGWLYYSATLDDFLGAKPMSERELHGLAHNFALVQQWLAERDIAFLLTIPPNKNTLYPEHMPAWYLATADEHNAQRLAAYLEAEGVTYLDLFRLFGNRDEELYLKQDSHWNAKGAVLAYGSIMASLGAEFKPLLAATPGTTEVIGDLNRMMYSFYGAPETDFDYNVPQRYTFGKEGATVEDGFILATATGAANGTLLMFRDSFGNTLIPLMANDFARSVWSKGQPNALERYVSLYAPDFVVIEQVERNIAQYLKEPPIIGAPEAAAAELAQPLRMRAADVTVDTCLFDVNYLEIRGEVTDGALATEADFFVSVNGTLYCAYQVGEAGFVLYVPAAAAAAGSAQILVFASE